MKKDNDSKSKCEARFQFAASLVPPIPCLPIDLTGRTLKRDMQHNQTSHTHTGAVPAGAPWRCDPPPPPTHP